MIKWFNSLERWVKRIIAIVAILTALSPILTSTIKVSKKYVRFVLDGPELLNDIQELKSSLFVLTGVVPASLEDVDDNEYYLYLGGVRIEGRIKRTISGDLYVFIPDEEMGEKAFSVVYHNDRSEYYFIDFSGKYIPLIKK